MAALGLALEIFGPAALVAGVTSLLIVAIVQRWLPVVGSKCWALPVAVAFGYCAGYAALPSWAALLPQQGRAWQWLPYLGVLAVCCAFINERYRVAHWLAAASLEILSASLLTPNWPIFGLSWPASIVVLSAYLFGLFCALEFSFRRSSLKGGFLALLSLAAAITAVGIGAALSTRLAQLAAIAATAFLGCWLATFFPARPTERTANGAIWVFTVLVGGAAFTACVEPEKPMTALLLLPALPLVASPFARRRIS
jgi:hypothetical protein